jgi:hypothetical protein
MRESRKYGSVRGALSNERPYRDRPCCICSQPLVALLVFVPSLKQLLLIGVKRKRVNSRRQCVLSDRIRFTLHV